VQAVEKRFRLVEQKTPALVRWYIARRGVQHRENRLAYVGLELGIGLAWLLEIQLVKLLLAYRLFHRLSRANVHPRSPNIRHAQENDRAENVGPEQRTKPGDPRPPVVSYDDRLRLAEGVDEANNISAQLENIVVLDSLRVDLSRRNRAGPARRRGILPQPTASIGGAKSTTTPASRGKGQLAAPCHPRRGAF
jgi:hypothetical protein